MAKIVAGFASSHTPLMSLPGQDWAKRAEDDKRNRELIRPADGKHVTYDELLEGADPKIAASHIHEDVFCQKFSAIQMALNELQETSTQVNPDVVVMFGDDQDELFFDDNYPMISLYYGDILTHYPRISTRPGMSEAVRISSSVYGTEIIDYPVKTDLGKFLVSELAERDFDIAQSRYMKEEYGGTIGPGCWYLVFLRKHIPQSSE